jgi:hypothetical protein
MADDTREFQSEPAPVFLAWGMPMEAREDFLDGPAMWLTGGVTLLLWTAVALLLTAT